MGGWIKKKKLNIQSKQRSREMEERQMWIKWWTDWLNEWMNERMNKWVNEWMKEWKNESEWMNEWILTITVYLYCAFNSHKGGIGLFTINSKILIFVTVLLKKCWMMLQKLVEWSRAYLYFHSTCWMAYFNILHVHAMIHCSTICWTRTATFADQQMLNCVIYQCFSLRLPQRCLV